MTDVVWPAPASAATLNDGDATQPQESPQVDAEAHDKLAQMKSELERLLELQRGWAELQQRKLEQKQELEEILASHAVPVTAAAVAEECGQDVSVRDEQPQAVETTAQPTESDEQKQMAVRKEELQLLQEQAAAVTKKQQQTESVLTKKLEELNAARVSAADSTIVSSTTLPAKRKLDDAAPSKGARTPKRLATALLVSTKLHEFTRAPASLTTSPDWEHAALFRIAVRYYLQTHQRISAELLADKFKTYTGSATKSPETAAFHTTLPLLPQFSRQATRHKTGSDSVVASHGHTRPWCPGGQSLAVATLCASEHVDLVASIELEKQAVEQVCASVLRDPSADVPQTQRIQDAACQAMFFTNLTGVIISSTGASTGTTPSSIYHALSDVMGYSSALESTSRRSARSHRFREFAGFFDLMKTWLTTINADGEEEGDDNGETTDLGALETVHRHKTLASSTVAAATSRKPFDLDQDFVFQQVRSFRPATSTTDPSKPRKTKKLDPMNMLCMYELSGVCNDENCPYQHQRDFEVSDEGDAEEDEGKSSEPRIHDDPLTPKLVSKEQMRLLQDFAHLRSKVMRKWPVITGQGIVAESPRSKKPISETSSVSKPSDEDNSITSTSVNDKEEDDGSFLQLEDESEAMHLDLNRNTISGGSRYCEGDEAVGFSIQALEEKIARDPADTDSWLMLAIHQLDFEVKQSDDTTRISDSARLLGQLTSIFRCVHLSAFSASSSVLDEAKLKLSLHTLSRAIEIEANAYCEALWLLYLHLSSLLPKRDYDSEFEMAEQAMQLIPSSHRLWVHYMAVGKLDSIELSEALHSRVLCHVSKPGSFQSADDDDDKGETPNLSGLLTALVIHLCMKLRGAGSTRRALELLNALLLRVRATQDKDKDKDRQSEAGSGFDWCAIVRSQLNWSDIATLAMVYAHLLLFDEIPMHIHKWLRVSGDQQQVHVAAFGFTYETFQEECVGLGNLSTEDLRSTTDAYECAFRAVNESGEVDSEASSLFTSVVLTNWLILTAVPVVQGRVAQSVLDAFLSQHRELVLSLPDAAFTAAKILASPPLYQRQRAHELLVNMLEQSTAKTFPQALHYYLNAPRAIPAPASETESPLELDAMPRLAQELVSDADCQDVVRAIADVKSEMNPFARVKTLKKVLYWLLSAWMDQLAAAGRQANRQPTLVSSSTSQAVDIYVPLAICQLMSKLLEPSVAIDGLELVLNSSKLRCLSADSRQLAWTLRFALQLDIAITRDTNQPQAHKATAFSKPHRASLLQLLRRYMEAMNVVSESLLQASSRISSAIEHEGVQSAVFECMYPQHSPWLLLHDNLAMFEFCAAAIPEFELPSLYSAYSYWLSPSPRFCLAYGEVATHHWEWRKIRRGLRKCLLDSSPHDTALRALVALELKNQNVKGVVQILEDELSADPLSMEAWSLVLGMEILFGESGASVRENELVTELTKRKLTVRASLFNDVELFASNSKSSLRESNERLKASRETGDFRGWGIHRVPDALLMMGNLRTLDLSCNFLVEIPEAISRLTKLEVLNVSQNALVTLPASLSKLPELRALNASHNNLSAVSGTLWVHLLKLQELDLSGNAIAHLPAPPLSRLQELRVLQISNNLLSSENVAQIRQLMAPKCGVDDGVDSTSADESSSNTVKNAGEKDEVSGEQVAIPDAETQQIAVDVSTGSESDEGDGMAVDETAKPSADGDDDVSVLEDGEIEDEVDVAEQNGADQPTTTGSEEEQSPPETSNAPEIESQGVPEPTQAPKGNYNDRGNNVEMAQLHQPTPPEEPSRGMVVDLSDENQTETCNGSTAIATTMENGDLEIYKAAELTDKFEAYINENHVSRAQLKLRNPTLWCKYVESQVHLHAGLGNCVMCDLPNEGWNQRLNTMVLCPSCLRCAVEMLQARSRTTATESIESESKDEC